MALKPALRRHRPVSVSLLSRSVHAAAVLPSRGGTPVDETHQVQLYRVHDPTVCTHQGAHLQDVRCCVVGVGWE